MENNGILTHQSLSHLKGFSVQQVLLDRYGFVVENDEKLLKHRLFRQKSILEICPFFESIFPSLQLLKEDIDEVHFPSVGLYIEDVFKGYFHYTFSKARYQEHIVFVWTILKDEDAENRQNRQQTENNRILEIEKLEI
jgi:hypothetical protein